jgi:tetratricopeptide (TPR) repeat protein
MPSRGRSRIKQRTPRESRSLFDRRLWVTLALAVVTLVVYSPVRHNSFVNYDDDTYVTRNSHVQAGVTLSTIAWAVKSTEGDNWHPVTWLSHALDYDMFGDDAAGHHLTSAFLHAINAALLFQLLVAATGMMGRSLFVAAVFALHPFNVESVAWVSERKNVLSMLLCLLTIAAYGWYARQPNGKRYSVVAIAFLLGLAAKPMLVTVPFVLLLLDFWPLNRISGWSAFARTDQETPRRGKRSDDAVQKVSLGRAVLEKLPLLALSAGDAAVTLFAQHAGGAMRLVLPWGVRAENALYAYAIYLEKALWPSRLAPFYPHPGSSLRWWQAASAAAVLTSITALALAYHRTRPYLLVGWLWFLGTLVPVIGIIQVGEQAMADRYAYLPLIGIFVMLAWGMGDAADRLRLNFRWRAAAGAVVILVLIVLTWQQLSYWQNSIALWAHTVAVTSENNTAEDNLGGALLVEGRYDEALPHLENAARINPNDPTCRLDIAGILAQRGQLKEAIAEYRDALPLVRDLKVLPLIYENVALAYKQIHDYANARASYEQALRLDPQRASSRTAITELDVTEAVQKVSEHPTGQAYFRLGEALQQAGRTEEARAAYLQAVKLDSGLRVPANVTSQ